MINNNAKARVPKLRFSEFNRAWEEKQLDKIANFFKGKGLAKSDIIDDGKNKCIRYGELYTDYMEVINEINSSTNVDTKESVLSKYNDLLVPSSGETPLDIAKASCVNQEDVIIGGDINIVRFKIDHAPFFAYYLTNFKKIDIARYAQGISVIHLYNSNLKKLKVHVPSYQEQQKIASFLSSSDNLIENLEKQKISLEKYKKGMMKKIFSQEIRFKNDDGNEYLEWGERRIGEIGKTYTGLSGKSAEDFGTGKRYIQYKQIFNSSKIDLSKCGFVEVEDNDNQNSATYGDVFFTTSSETPNEVAYSSVLLKKADNIYLNSFCFGYRINNFNELMPKFAQYLFRSEFFRSMVHRLAQGSTRYNISKTELMKLYIKLPEGKEQEKIASLLSLIDKSITQKEMKIKLAKQWKKGLLQQMFV